MASEEKEIVIETDGYRYKVIVTILSIEPTKPLTTAEKFLNLVTVRPGADKKYESSDIRTGTTGDGLTK